MNISNLPTYPAAKFRKRLSDMVINAAFKHRAVGISVHGKLVAALVPIALVELCQELAQNSENSAVQNDITVQITNLMRRLTD